MRLALLLFFGALVSGVHAQGNATTRPEAPVKRIATIHLADHQAPEAYIEYLSYPKPGGEAYHRFLMEQKAKAAALFPPSQMSNPERHGLVDPPEVIRSFSGNAVAGIPLDNHLAVNNNDQIVSVINVHMLVIGPTGVWQEAYSLDAFWEILGEDDLYFDPRIIYDPEADRFVMVMMQDFDCDGSNIVFAFSASSDPTGAWHLYQFEGCPLVDDTFADYPMISLTDRELFFTYNAVYQDSTWQTGFNETLIYQIDKFDGYAGEPLDWRSWQGITHAGRKLRYICPVKYATAALGSEAYFLSNRSFDIQNDTIWKVHIDGPLDAPDVTLTVEALISDVSYGVPPTAEQPVDFLQTNDARVLDAFYTEDHIQFVSNTMDPATGRSGVFHGIIDFVASTPTLQATILSNGADHLAYPGIAFTGPTPFDREAIIIASHASADRFPGYSALYYNDGYSDWVTVKEGLRVIDMIKVDNNFGADPTLERWGDYSGIQPKYDEDGTVYTASTYGKPGNFSDTWIGYLKRPGKPTSAGVANDPLTEITAFPNPVAELVTIDVVTPAAGKVLRAGLHDGQGRLLRSVLEQEIRIDSPVRFYYDVRDLPAGTYAVRLTLDGVPVGSRTIVVE